MKRIIFLLLLAVGIYQYLAAPSTSIETPPPKAKDVTGKQVVKHELMELFDAGTAFADLAEPGHYTVIEKYLDTCGVCKELESGFGAFARARTDVRVVRVRAPEGGVSFSPKTQEELESILSRMQKLGGDCTGTPFIQIYGPDRKLMISDQCKSGSHYYALDALRQWMAAEAARS